MPSRRSLASRSCSREPYSVTSPECTTKLSPVWELMSRTAACKSCSPVVPEPTWVSLSQAKWKGAVSAKTKSGRRHSNRPTRAVRRVTSEVWVKYRRCDIGQLLPEALCISSQDYRWRRLPSLRYVSQGLSRRGLGPIKLQRHVQRVGSGKDERGGIGFQREPIGQVGRAGNDIVAAPGSPHVELKDPVRPINGRAQDFRRRRQQHHQRRLAARNRAGSVSNNHGVNARIARVGAQQAQAALGGPRDGRVVKLPLVEQRKTTLRTNGEADG